MFDLASIDVGYAVLLSSEHAVSGPCRMAVLQLWKRKRGMQATYGNLLRVCLDTEFKSCAAVIVKLWADK